MNNKPAFTKTSMLVSHLVIITAFFALPILSRAESVAVLLSVHGKIEAKLKSGPEGVAGTSAWTEMKKGQEFNVGDELRTAAGSKGALRFKSGYLVRLGENTNIKFSPEAAEEKTSTWGKIEASVGKLFFFSRKPKEYPRITTPQLSAAVRGTEFSLEVASDRTEIQVSNGVVDASNGVSAERISKGERIVGEVGKPLVKTQVVRFTDSVQWSVYYPLTLEKTDLIALLPKDERDAVVFGKIWESLATGEVVEAISLIDEPAQHVIGNTGQANTSEAIDASQLRQLLRGISQLLLGRSGEARLAFEALKSQVGQQLGHTGSEREKLLVEICDSQLALLGLLGGSREEARSQLPTSPTSDTALHVRSYLEQAEFSPETALATVDEVLQRSPQSPTLKTRVAELALALGEDEVGVMYADELVTDYPEIAYPHVLKGFQLLGKNEPGQALVEFERAQQLDGNLGLASFGEGLALIAKGDLASGRESLENAVLLEPTVSLYRSYLGKAYFEEDKEELAGGEFLRATELDPQDPTPHLYKSFLDMSQNKPVAAVRGIARSRALNKNRALYRSKMQLDNDAGVRSSSLANVYKSLGFQELARLLSQDALRRNYSDYSAHYTLGSLYQGAHEGRTVELSEKLMARLLSPPSFNSSRMKSGSAGSATTSFNEYTALFDRPAGAVNTTAGYETASETSNGSIEATAGTPGAVASAGVVAYNREGFRDNDFERLYQVYGQGDYQITEKLQIVTDASLAQNDRGDTIFNWDPKIENEDYSQDLDEALLRLGLRSQIDKDTNLVGQVAYIRNKYDQTDLANQSRLRRLTVYDKERAVGDNSFTIDPFVDEHLNLTEDQIRADLQLILDREQFTLITGLSGTLQSWDSTENSIVTGPGSFEVLNFLTGYGLNSEVDSTNKKGDVFSYLTWHATSDVNVDLGLTYTALDYGENLSTPPYYNGRSDESRFLPKFGFTWDEVLSGLGLRGAISRTFASSSRGEIGKLEPSFVGGFNQLLDSTIGQEGTLYAIGADQDVGGELHVGVSYRYWQLERSVPFYEGAVEYDRSTQLTTPSVFLVDEDSESSVSRVDLYAYKILSDEFVAALNYGWEYYREDYPFADTETFKITPAIRYFNPSGFFCGLHPSLRSQEHGGGTFEKTTDTFFTLDASLGYQFAERRGVIQVRGMNLLDEDFRYSPISEEEYPWVEAGVELGLNYRF